MPDNKGAHVNRYRYGFTVGAPETEKLERIVNGARLTYLKRAGRVQVFDGLRRLPIDLDTEKQILRSWPGADPIDWWD